MSQKRTTTYTCDHCRKDVAKKGDLRRLVVHGTPWKNSIPFDVCDPCEAEFVTYLAGWVPDGEDANTLRRP